MPAIPAGFAGATPYLCVRDAAASLDFYVRAFGAVETMRLTDPQGKIGHAELKVGNAAVMLSDEYPDHGACAPETIGGSPVKIHLYVPDVDAFLDRAVAAGARLDRPAADPFYGDRSGAITDPFGHGWMIATHKEDVAPDELNRRFAALYK